MSFSVSSVLSAVKDVPGAFRALERFLLPNACVACDRVIVEADRDVLVCGACRHRLKPLTGGCARCHQPLPLIGACRFCAAWPEELVEARSAVWLDPEARQIVHHLKYQGFSRLARFMADTIVRHLPRPGEVLVPIPLAPDRLRERGYNQAACIARELAARWRVSAREELLTRRRAGGSQTALTPQERAANVADAFAARARGAGAGGVVIVDDVLTTGATLVAAARALAGVGWQHITAVTFARALPFERRMT